MVDNVTAHGTGEGPARNAEEGGNDDRLLVARVQRGDVEAFDALVRRHTRQALAIARRLLGNAEDAEDLVQDAFLRALDRIASFDTSRAFAPWFFRLLVNLGLNTRKSAARRAMADEPLHVASDDPGPDQVVERQEVRDRFEAALATLPARQRLIVSLYEVDGVPTAEIARMLEVTQETVRWHLHHARRTLRAALDALRD